MDGGPTGRHSAAPSLDLGNYWFVLVLVQWVGRLDDRKLDAIPEFASRGNELVVWIDDEKRRDLFAELQMWQDPGSYANSAGVASDPENRSTQDLSGFWFRP